MEHNQNHFAPEAATDEPASPCSSITDFEPVPLRYRTDGLTPAKQREYVEALADTGVAREAAARIGISEQAVNRVRRRADARAFDLACEAAQRIGARCLRSIAWERAIEGTVKRIYYHGEVKSEEIVYDNRLLIYLLGKAEKALEPPPEAEAVAANWEGWMDAVERGLPEPERPPERAPAEGHEAFLWDGEEVWLEDDGRWWTTFPPPEGFCGVEEGTLGGEGDYRRTLSAAEEAMVETEEEEEREDYIAAEAARRDCYFGFAGGREKPRVFRPREAELYETSADDPGRRPDTEDG
ncbi:MAG TPA: hypothetical protein VEZ20_10240 [Allosphingosinicella sp.]|jgi:hypothetical protein|nr:hypothetical protein [Allosphingosinicella sp.]